MEELVAKLGAEFVNSIHAAALADPDAMRRFVSDIPPKAEPVQAYLTDVDTRRALFDELRAICWPCSWSHPSPRFAPSSTSSATWSSIARKW